MKWKSLFWWIYTAVQLFWATILLKTCRGLIVNVQHVSIICYCLLKYHDDDILLADYETKMLMKIQVITIITAILLLQCVWLPFKIITDKLNNKILQCFFFNYNSTGPKISQVVNGKDGQWKRARFVPRISARKLNNSSKFTFKIWTMFVSLSAFK